MSTDTKILYRSAIESDVAGMVSLMNSEYARKKRPSYFIWQYFHSAYPTIVMTAIVNEEIVGLFGLQKRKLNSGAVVGQAIDLIVASKWRKRGIFTQLGNKAISYWDDLDLLLVLPNQNGKNACERSFGWITIGKIDEMVLLVVDSKLIKPHNSDTYISLENDRSRYESFIYDDRIRSWRYDQHPDHRYGYVHLASGEFAVTKLFIDPINENCFGDIVDFECDAADETKLEELFIKTCARLIEDGVEAITTWVIPNTPIYPIVKSLGFAEEPRERYFCVKILNPRYEKLYDISSWHLVQADAEIY